MGRHILQTLRRWLPRAGRFLWLCFCGFMVVLVADDFIQLHATPQDYAPLFGSEAAHGLWQYSSKAAYTAHGLLLLGWFAAGGICALGRGILRGAWTLPAHVALTLVYLTCA